MKLRPSVQRQLDANPSGLSDEERIARLVVFEKDYEAAQFSNHGPTRANAKDALDLLAALRERSA